MMKTIETTVYELDELNDKAKDEAREWYRSGALDYEWWKSTYEDAARVGLEITGFDVDRNRNATGKFTQEARVVADNILKEHGETCETFKTATEFLKERDAIVDGAEKDENGDFVSEADETIKAAGFDVEDDGPKIRALCAFLACEPDEITAESHDHYGLSLFSRGRAEYAIGTDSEAESAAKEDIKQSAWAFNASFLASFCDLPEEVFRALRDKCEDGNDAVLSLIEKSGGLDAFAEEAISADGRGHFLSSYDGDENEEGGFYIYRVN